MYRRYTYIHVCIMYVCMHVMLGCVMLHYVMLCCANAFKCICVYVLCMHT